jgi:hypothetical protein
MMTVSPALEDEPEFLGYSASVSTDHATVRAEFRLD